MKDDPKWFLWVPIGGLQREVWIQAWDMGAPFSHTQTVPQQPPSLREGLLQPLPGGWTDGKELAACPRKANSLLRLLYEGLANAHSAENRAAAQERE